MIGKTISHYRIVEKIGEGGMGVVYKALDLKLDRYVALKFLSPSRLYDQEAKQRFVHEAKAASAIDHPAIGTVYEIDETADGRMFIAMAYYDGMTLASAIEKRSLEITEALDVAAQAARGLSEAHTRGIVHRDIKPSNILVTREGAAKIVDFGLAKLSSATKITKTGVTTGTASYMSPEQAKGEEVDGRSDIFSLGIVIYEIISGRYPFKGEYAAAVLHSIVHDDPEPITGLVPELPAALPGILERALAKDPASRYQDAGQLAEDLAACRAALISGAGAAQAPSTGRRRRAAILAAIGVVSIAAVVAGYLVWGDRAGRQPRAAKAFAIAVAPFGGNNESAAAEGLVMQSLLVRKLREILSDEKGTRVAAMDRSRIPRSNAEATNLGRRARAAMVIWGEVLVLGDETDIQSHIALVNPLKELKEFSPGALRPEPTDPNQIDLRKQKAEKIGSTAIYIAANYLLKQDPERALSLVVALPDTSFKRFVLQGDILAALERPDESREAYEKASLLDPTDPLPHIRLGSDFETKEQYGEALAEFERAIAVKPDNQWSHLALAEFYAGRGMEEHALAALEKAQTLGTMDEAAISFAAWVYWRLGLYRNAVDQYRKAIAIAPQDAQLRISLGNSYRNLGEDEKAVAEYERAAALAPNDPGPPLSLAWLNEERGRHREAIGFFRKALTLDDTDFSTYIGLGHSYGKLGNRARAMKYFRGAEKCGQLWGNLINVFIANNYRELGWYKEAIAEFAKSIETADDTMFTDRPHYELGRLYDELGKYGDAASEYGRALAIEPTIKFYYYHFQYFLALCRLGRREEARAHIREYAKELGESEWYSDELVYALADYFLGKGAEERVLQLAQGTDPDRNTGCDVCRARYYLGISRLFDIRVDADSSSVDTAKAVAHLKAGREACGPCIDSEYHDRIETELRRLEKSP